MGDLTQVIISGIVNSLSQGLVFTLREGVCFVRTARPAVLSSLGENCCWSSLKDAVLLGKSVLYPIQCEALILFQYASKCCSPVAPFEFMD